MVGYKKGCWELMSMVEYKERLLGARDYGWIQDRLFGARKEG